MYKSTHLISEGHLVVLGLVAGMLGCKKLLVLLKRCGGFEL